MLVNGFECQLTKLWKNTGENGMANKYCKMLWTCEIDLPLV